VALWSDDWGGEWGPELFDLLRPDSPLALDALERSLWLDISSAPVLDAIVEQRVERRWHGPIQATVVGKEPEAALMNLLLGAADAGAVSEGHLGRALEWIDSLELDCRVTLDPEGEEAVAAEELLNQWGYAQAESQLRLLRDASEPDFPAPAGIEVVEIEKFTEGFGELLSEGYELGQSRAWLFDCLPGRYPWRCYLALDEENGHILAAAAIMLQWGMAAHLGFAATAEEARERGCHRALLHRCILDAGKDDCPLLLAETSEPLGERDGPSPGARNLLRTGFRQASVRATWRRRGG
jgi:hypothetical protein